MDNWWTAGAEVWSCYSGPEYYGLPKKYVLQGEAKRRTVSSGAVALHFGSSPGLQPAALLDLQGGGWLQSSVQARYE